MKIIAAAGPQLSPETDRHNRDVAVPGNGTTRGGPKPPTEKDGRKAGRGGNADSQSRL